MASKKNEVRIICQNPKCDKAGKPQDEGNYYRCNTSGMSKYPICKDCIHKLVNINDMKTVYDILMAMNIVFIKSLWDKIAERYPENPFGRYITEINRSSRYKAMGYEKSVFQKYDEETDSLVADEDDENVTIYSEDWRGKFTKAELAYLDDYYNGLLSDFKVVTTNHKDYARKLSKASLAMDKEFEKVLRGESDTIYKNLRDTFDKLSSSAKFSETQRSANDTTLGSFGEIAALVENHTWIPDYEPTDKDTYDVLIDQFSNVEKSL